MRINYVLIDYENVQPEKLSVLNREPFKIWVFLGTNQKVSADTLIALQSLGDRATSIKISGNGHNALDFHIAYYLGQLSEREPTAFFHIISKDSGFDPLIDHLRSKHFLAARRDKVVDIPLLQTLELATKLERLGMAKPGNVKALCSVLNNLLRRELSSEEFSSLLKILQREGIIGINDHRIIYPTFDEDSSQNP